MKKKILVLMLGLLLIAVNLYAAGDLIVEGNVGIGTTSPQARLEINTGTAGDKGLIVKGYAGQSGNLQEWQNSTGSNLSLIDENGYFSYGVTNPFSPIHLNRNSFSAITTTDAGQAATILNKKTSGNTAALYSLSEFANTASESGFGAGLNALAYHTGTANLTSNTVPGLMGGRYGARVLSNSPVVVTRAVGISARVEIADTKTATITNAIGFYTEPIKAEDGTITNAYNFYGKAHLKDTGTLTNAYGMWLEKQTVGSTRNSGIVLAGDGAGADIVFGPTQNARIYSEGGYLKAQDVRGNVTQFSPHDPETGEWIFYSKNVKTGKVVRVNMEKLVKAVEKLTGEKFMVEAIE